MVTRVHPWPAGVPCWAEIDTSDVGAASDFYGAVLGWSFEDLDPAFGGYRLGGRGGAPAAGIAPRRGAGVARWTLSLASEDVDATASAITAAGGTVDAGPDEVGGLGRRCAATDPSGAGFAVWQAGSFIGASLANEPGAVTWEDLRSTDPATAQAFYSSVFGYRMEPLAMAGPDYAVFCRPDEAWPLGGMGGMMGEEGPSYWLVYFAVEDADAAAAATVAGGGTVRSAPADTPFGRMAMLADPEGARFCAFTPNPGQPQPARGE